MKQAIVITLLAAATASFLPACATTRHAETLPSVLYANATDRSIWVRLDSSARVPDRDTVPDFIRGNVMRIGPRDSAQLFPPRVLDAESVQIYRVSFAAVGPSWERAEWRTYEAFEGLPRRIRFTLDAQGRLQAQSDSAPLVPVP